MSTNTIDILINAKDQATATIKKVSDSVNNSQKAFKTMAVAGGIAFGALTWVIMKSVDAAQESEKVHAQLEAVLKSTWGAVWLTAKQIEAHSAALQKNLGIADEVIASGQNMLITFTNIGKDTFPRATETLLDMATAMNGWAAPGAEALSWQAIQLGKALNDPIAGISALTRVGVTFTEQQKETIKSMVEMWDTAGAQKVILDELSKEFWGSALAQANTFEGQMRKLKVSFDDIFENLGKALIPSLQKLADTVIPIIQSFANWTEQNPQFASALLISATAIAGLITALWSLGIVMPAIQAWISAIWAVIAALWWPITLTIAGVGLLATAWATNFGHIQEITKIVLDFISWAFDAFSVLLTWDFNGFSEKSIEIWNHLFSEIKSYFPNFYSSFEKVWLDIESTTVKTLTRITLFVVGKVIEVQKAINDIKQSLKDAASFLTGGLIWGSTPAPIKVDGKAANWWYIWSWQTFLVWERGPELFTPSSSGNITPNNQLGGVSVSINFGGVSVRNDNDINSIASIIKDTLTREIQLSKLGIAS